VFPIDEEWLSYSVRHWFSTGGDGTLGVNYQHLNKDSVVMEIGAYHGAWTRVMSDKYGCKILAYEPVEGCHAICADSLGSYENVMLKDYGLSDKTEDVTLYLDEDGSSMSKKTDEITTIKVVDVVEELEEIGTKIDLIHLNIEGEEYDFLDRLIDSGKINDVRSLMVQFHYHDGRESFDRRLNIQKKLADTHTMKFNFDFVWERWDIRS